MVFSSLSFLFWFLPLTVAVHGGLPHRFRNGFLLLASLFFYAWGEPVYVLLMLLSIVCNFRLGLKLAVSAHPRQILAAGMVWNFGLLAVFKYTGMVAETLAALTGLPLSITAPSLPLGISFYTFQAASYLIDLYRGQATPQKRIVDFGLYITLFAQLVAGPIVRYPEVAPQLTARRIDCNGFAEGVRRFLLGLGKKVLLANNLGAIWETVHAAPVGDLSMVSAWVGLLAFALQLYFDFSGYSDMAVGIGKLLGFTLPENFQYPYLADSISAFWRRWHMTLGQWFRTYLYIPLGGSRAGRLRLVRNLLLVWVCTGLWHGAAWNFALWGLYYGCLLILEKLWLGRILARLPGIVRHGYTLLAVGIGWVLFACTGPGEIPGFLEALFCPNGHVVVGFSKKMIAYLMVGVLAATPVPTQLAGRVSRRFPRLETPMAAALYGSVTVLAIAGLVGATYQPFLYFRF